MIFTRTLCLLKSGNNLSKELLLTACLIDVVSLNVGRDSAYYKSSVQSTPHFCIMDTEYSVVMQNEIIMESYYPKIVTSNFNISISKTVISKYKIGVLTSLKWGYRMTVISDYVLREGSFCLGHSMQFWERLEFTFLLSA